MKEKLINFQFFSSDNTIVIETLNPLYQNVVGASKSPTFFDVKLINIHYDCISKIIIFIITLSIRHLSKYNSVT